MYKVITHTIREEHFTHPATAEYALTGGHMGNAHVYGGHMGSHMGNVMARTSGIRGEFSSPAAVLYRGWIRNTMETYVNNLRGALVSIHSTGEEVPLLEQRIASSIDDIVAMLRPYYSTGVTNVLKQGLSDYTTDLLDFFKAHKDGKPTSDIENRIAQHATAIADAMAMANPHWRRDESLSYYTWFADAFKNQSAARKAKNWGEDQAAFDSARETFLTGMPDQATSLSQYIAKGVISQYPQKFR